MYCTLCVKCICCTSISNRIALNMNIYPASLRVKSSHQEGTVWICVAQSEKNNFRACWKERPDAEQTEGMMDCSFDSQGNRWRWKHQLRHSVKFELVYVFLPVFWFTFTYSNYARRKKCNVVIPPKVRAIDLNWRLGHVYGMKLSWFSRLSSSVTWRLCDWEKLILNLAVHDLKSKQAFFLESSKHLWMSAHTVKSFVLRRCPWCWNWCWVHFKVTLHI